MGGGFPAGLVISTKLDRDPETNVFRRRQARRSLEQSLVALGSAVIDLFRIRNDLNICPAETTVETALCETLSVS